MNLLIHVIANSIKDGVDIGSTEGEETVQQSQLYYALLGLTVFFVQGIIGVKCV